MTIRDGDPDRNRSRADRGPDFDPGEVVASVVRTVGANGFDRWYRERRWAENLKAGKAGFNGPRTVPPPARHSPSSLLQCHRKVTYRQHGTPRETPAPEGLFWIGRRFQEEIIIPYLESAVLNEQAFVSASMWIDVAVETTSGVTCLVGATDPVIVDRDGTPLLVTEIKTKSTVETLTAPNDHHRAQVHAYMYGLERQFECDVRDAIIIYGGRDRLTIKPFRVPFDRQFWRRTVVPWIETHTRYRRDGQLPPGAPEFDWECDVCPFRSRCGKADPRYAERGVTGFLPLFDGYPENSVTAYLEAHGDDGVKLTPTLASRYPHLVDRYGVHDWECPRCASSYAWCNVPWEGEPTEPPSCPTCGEASYLIELHPSLPEDD